MHYKQLFDQNIGLTKHARYLGPQMHWQNSAHIEVDVRIKNAWACWQMYRVFWTSNASMDFKRQ
eukprot:2106918-Karenia_brevis.AAC.1